MKVTVWLNYHEYEGWRPNDFDSEEEAAKFILGGSTYQPMRVTTDLELRIEKKEVQP